MCKVVASGNHSCCTLLYHVPDITLNFIKMWMKHGLRIRKFHSENNKILCQYKQYIVILLSNLYCFKRDIREIRFSLVKQSTKQ